MSTNVGTVVLNVRANIAQLTKGLSKAQKETNKSVRLMKKAFVALTVAFSAKSIVDGINQMITSMDGLAKTASKLGTTTEQLTSLSYAAERAGVSSTTFEMAMQRMTRRSAEAAVGVGEAKGALKELNIDAKDFNNLSLENKMKTLADSFKEVKNPADQLRLSFKLFDSEGAALINMLKNGSGEISKFQDISNKLGNTLSSKTAKDAEKAADAITNFNKAFQGITNNIAANFLPAINTAFNAIQDLFNIPRTKLLEELTEDAKNLKNEIKDMEKVKWYDSFLNEKTAATNLKLTKDKLIEVNQKILDINSASKKTKLDITIPNGEATKKTVEDTKKAFQSLKETLIPLEAIYAKTAKQVDVTEAALASGAINNIEYAKTMKLIGDNTSEAIEKLNDVGTSDKLNEARLALQQLKETLDPTTAAIALATEQVRILDDAIANGVKVSTEEYDEILKKIGDNVAKAFDKKKVEEMKDSMNELKDLGIGLAGVLGNSIGGAFSDIMEDTFSWKDTMVDLLKAVVNELIRVFVVQQLVKGITGGYNVASTGGAGGAADLIAAKGAVVSGGSHVKAYAKGGIVDAPTNFPMSGNNVGLMGEAGPEAIVPLSRSADGSLGVGASPVNVEINNYGQDNVSVEQDGDKIKVIIRAVESSIANGISKGTGKVGTAIIGMKSQGRL